jgi:hypothetical protein
MELITILNHCHRHRGFVYQHARFGPDQKSIEVAVRPREGSAAVCSGCHQSAPGYDHLPERCFEFIPLWGFLATEWSLGAAAVFALAHFGRYSLIPQFLGVIIGLHFLPLAKLLRAPRYYLMGTAMVLCVLASLLIPEGSIRNVIACAAIGLPMWITAVAILSQS